MPSVPPRPSRIPFQPTGRSSPVGAASAALPKKRSAGKPAPTPTPPPCRIGVTPAREAGFTYLLLLFFVAILGAGLAAISDVWMTSVQQEREKQLLFIGSQYRSAIARYFRASPGGVGQYPARLEDLLADPRQPTPQRYLRNLYPDPLSDKMDWVLVRAPQGGIMGVASPAEERPLKTAGFEGANRVFDPLAERLGDKLRYRDWEFSFDPSLNQPGYP